MRKNGAMDVTGLWMSQEMLAWVDLIRTIGV